MPDPKTAVQELETLKQAVSAQDQVIADLQKKAADDKAALDAAIAVGAELQAKAGELGKQVADLTAKVAKADADCAAAVKLAEEQQARADKAEKKLAMDPNHIDVSGRSAPVPEGGGSSDNGATWEAALQACGGDYSAARKKYPEAFEAYMKQFAAK